MHLYEKCNFEGVRAGNMKLHSRRNVIPTRKMGKGLFIPQEIMGGLGNRGMQDFFVNLFSPAAKWCCPEGKSIEFFFSNEERSSSERFLLKDNIFIWVREKNPQTFPLKDKRESDFPKKLHHFAKGEKKWQKNFAIPMLSNLSMISRGIRSPFPIFRVGITFMRECFHFPRTHPFSIFCYLTKLIFFPFCWILNAGNGVFNKWFILFDNFQVKEFNFQIWYMTPLSILLTISWMSFAFLFLPPPPKQKPSF